MYSILGYRVDVVYHHEYRCFFSDIPSLKICIAYGNSEEEALSEVAKVIQDHLYNLEYERLNAPAKD